MARVETLPRRPARQSRCAIYTRKSTEEGLEQDFNSLDAQREACAAFIQSQKQEGWTALLRTYDDGGYSGGSMERPALKQLLADIEARRVDVIVVYKVDRLTRSLPDFAKLVEIFDRCGVSFVSVTQQFNTTTSMGRLTLNILLSFAQFERELIGERVRDKVAASKKKGMWMGGTVPLGYDVKNRKLVVNKAEAKTVVEIYRRYLKLKSVRALRENLDTAGIRSKRRTRADGSQYGHQKFSQGALYLMLQNQTYRGEATHKGKAYPGEHAAIVDKSLWDAVQDLLAQNRVERTNSASTKEPSLLTGLLFGENGARLTPTWTSKKGTRYRYYVSTPLVTGNGSGRSVRQRIPAGDIENAVIGRLRDFLSSPRELIDAIGARQQKNLKSLLERGLEIADQLGRTGDHQKAIMTALARRVVVRSKDLSIQVSQDHLNALIYADMTFPTTTNRGQLKQSDRIHKLTVAAKLRRAGREMKLVINEPNTGGIPDMALLRVVARARDIQVRLEADTNLTVQDIASAEGVSSAYIYSLLRLRWLAPRIVTAIVDGRQPEQFTARRLMRLSARLPMQWAEQRELLDFR
jgi:DNA invertase Pin-like site-specific DNA recombinase